MTATSPTSADREARLVQVLDAYLAALHEGTPADPAELLARYPDLADDLRECLASLEFIRRAEVQPEQWSAGGLVPGEGDSLARLLGDFRILREVGRGGMGVVYEAEQVSLHRRVALKVLPFAATMDARHLQRFHNEAQAAACLHHTNIVPVFSVGCERGVHFYAMQFIDGQPLSEVIRQLREREKRGTDSVPTATEERTTAYQPAPAEAVTTRPTVGAADVTPLSAEGRRGRDYYRKVAELGVQAAEALDHAHQVGIVHRDVKPGNLLLDGDGRLWVTDFGLAHMQQSEASLTVTGQALGTPRYMSPEQALAKRVPIDHRTDVYSLGATLYELLTLRPAFLGEDRQELLRQIAFEDPARPRRLERAIPAELEIIVLKAMEKRPQDRYATTQELADDLRRWLMHEPIRARRPGLVHRATKWGRRHRPLVFAGVVSLLLALVLLAISNLVIWREHEITKEALQKARIHQQETLLSVDREARMREEFEVKLRRSLEGMDRTLTALEEPFPEEGTEAARTYKAASELALKFYQEVLPIETRRLSLILEMMWAYVRLGNFYAWRNQFSEAREAYGMASKTVGKWRDLRRTTGPDGEAWEPAISLSGEVLERPAVVKAYRRALAHWRKTDPRLFERVGDFRLPLVEIAYPPTISDQTIITAS